MSALIHPDELIQRLRHDRRRCFVVIGQPGEGKTRLAKAMAERYDGNYLDLLALFAARPDLCAEIDVFTPQYFRQYLQEEYAQGDLLLIDEMEFLWARWDSSEKREFLSNLSLWEKSAFFGVFLPPDPVLESFEMPDQDKRPRIFWLRDLQALG